MLAVDEDLNAVTARNGHHQRLERHRHGNAILFTGGKIAFADLEADGRLGNHLSIFHLHEDSGFMGVDRLGGMDHHMKSQSALHGGWEGRPIQPSDATAKDMKQAFPNGSAIAEESAGNSQARSVRREGGVPVWRFCGTEDLHVRLRTGRARGLPRRYARALLNKVNRPSGCGHRRKFFLCQVSLILHDPIIPSSSTERLFGTPMFRQPYR
jgi:hypothetical protein